jgi:hypothetical protein
MWTRRLKRYGGLAGITARRLVQTRMLVRAQRHIGKVAALADDTLKWLAENELRCLNDAEVEWWRLHA